MADADKIAEGCEGGERQTDWGETKSCGVYVGKAVLERSKAEKSEKRALGGQKKATSNCGGAVSRKER